MSARARSVALGRARARKDEPSKGRSAHARAGRKHAPCCVRYVTTRAVHATDRPALNTACAPPPLLGAPTAAMKVRPRDHAASTASWLAASHQSASAGASCCRVPPSPAAAAAAGVPRRWLLPAGGCCCCCWPDRAAAVSREPRPAPPAKAASSRPEPPLPPPPWLLFPLPPPGRAHATCAACAAWASAAAAEAALAAPAAALLPSCLTPSLSAQLLGILANCEIELCTVVGGK